MTNELKVADQEDGTGRDDDNNDSIKKLIQERKKEAREPLTIAKVIRTPGLDQLSEAEALEVVHTIQKLSVLLFDMRCAKESFCIDNQQVVSLINVNKAA